MSLRILAIGDAHFKTNNIKEVDHFLKRLQNFLEIHGDDIDICVNLGDTLHEHSRLHITPLNKAIEYTRLLSRYKPTYVLIGNHCAINNSIFLTDNHWANCLKGWKNVTVVDKVVIDTIKGVKVTFCPYVPDGRLLEALNTCKDEWRDSSCIFSHVTITGADMGNAIAITGTTWNENFPLLVSGHIHKSQWIGKNMYYTGSAMQVDVNESPDKHICIVNVKEGIPTVEEYDLDLIKKRIIHVHISDVGELKLETRDNIKYTLYIEGTYEEIKAFRKSNIYKTLQSRVQIQFKPILGNIEYKEEEKSFEELLTEGLVDNQLLHSFYRGLMYDEEDVSEHLDEYLLF